MSGFSIEVDDREITAALRTIAGRIQDLRQPMASIGQHLVTLTDQAFRREQDPWGHAWQPLAASTQRQRRKGKGGGADKILRDTGRLANSISYRADGRSVSVGTNVVYAAIHQFGGEIQHAARSGTVYFRRNQRTGEVGSRFVRKSKSNFAQDVTIGAHAVKIPRRPFLPIDAAGNADLPRSAVDDILGILQGFMLQGGKA